MNDKRRRIFGFGLRIGLTSINNLPLLLGGDAEYEDADAEFLGKSYVSWDSLDEDPVATAYGI